MRLDFTEHGVVLVRLSRRNLLALLSKLEQPCSARMIVQYGAYLSGVLHEDVVLAVQVEPDELHYADRVPAGVMSPATEAFIASHTPSSGASSASVFDERGPTMRRQHRAAWEDPAHGPRRPGIRSHRYPPGRLPVWCLDQSEVWCDCFGTEHLISRMPPDEVTNVISYLYERCELWFGLRLADLYLEAIEGSLFGLDGHESLVTRAAQIEALGPEEALEASPLMVALQRRLEKPSLELDVKRGRR